MAIVDAIQAQYEVDEIYGEEYPESYLSVLIFYAKCKKVEIVEVIKAQTHLDEIKRPISKLFLKSMRNLLTE